MVNIDDIDDLGLTTIGLRFLSSDLRLVKLFIVHHDLRDHRGNLLSVNSFLFNVLRCYFDERIYPFGDTLRVNCNVLLEASDHGKQP